MSETNQRFVLHTVVLSACKVGDLLGQIIDKVLSCHADDWGLIPKDCIFLNFALSYSLEHYE